MDKYAFVGCSSSNEIDNIFIESARRLSYILAKNNYNLVFGASDMGLMGQVYDVMKQENKKVVGVAPTIYADDFKILQCDEEFCVDTTSERINLMISKSDIICFLAGGTGTLEEIAIALELKRRKEINKSIIIYDENGFYLPFIKMLFNMEKLGFSNNIDNLFNYITNPIELDNYLKILYNEQTQSNTPELS